MADYKIELGVTVDTSDIVSQIDEAEKKVDPIKIKIDAETKELTNTIREALNSLSKGTKNALTLDTTKIEGSLTDIKNAVVDIKKTFNSIDSGANFKPLVSSVNQVSNALNKAENESDGLAKSLNALGKKDVKVNVGLDLDKKNNKITQDYNKSLAKKVSTNSDIDGFLRDFNLTSRKAKVVRDNFLALTKAASHGIDSDVYEKSLSNLVNSVKKLGTVSKEIDSEASNIIKALNSYHLDVSGDYYKQEFGDDWKSVRGKHQSMLADKNSLTKTSVDVAYEELVERFPEYFSKEIWNQADQLRKIFDVYDTAKLNSRARKVNVSEVYDDSYLRNYASDIVSDIQEQVRAEQQLVQSSNAATDTVIQNQQRQQEAIKANLEAKKAEIEQEKKRLAEINKSIDDYNNRFLEASTTGDPNAMEYYAKMQSLEADSESLKSHIDALDAAYNKEVQQAQEAANAVSQAEERKQQVYRETANTIQSISKQTSLVRDNVDFKQVFDGGNQSAKEAQRYFEDLLKEEKAVISVKESFDSSFGNSGELKSFTVDIQRATGEVEKLHYAMSSTDDDNRFLYQGASVSDKNIEKQTEARIKTADKLQTKLEEIKKQYEDKGSTKPIKDSDHIDSLGKQYKVVEKAINDIRNADNTTSASMISNAEKQKSILENMVREYRNAESVATSLRSKDFDTVKATYNDKLDEKIYKIQGTGLSDSNYGEIDGKMVSLADRAKQLKSILSNATDKTGLVQFLNELDKLESKYKSAKVAKDEFNKSQNVGSSVSGLKSELEILQQASPSIKSFKTEINGAEVSIESLLKDLDQVSTKGDFKVVEGKVEAFGKAAEAAGIDLNEAKNEAKKANDAYKQMLDIQKQIRSLSIKEKNLTELGSTNELNEVSAKLKDLKADYEALKRTFGGKLTDVQFGTLQAEVDATESELKQLDAKWADTKAKLAKSIKLDIELGNVDNQMDTMRVKFNSLSDANRELRNSFDATEDAYKAMINASKANSGDEVADRERLIQTEKKYAAALEKTNNLIKQQARIDSMAEAAEKLADKKTALQLDMASYLKENSRAANEFGDEIKRLSSLLDNVSLDDAGVNKISRTFKNLTKEIKNAGKDGLTVFDKLKSKAKEYMTYLSAAEVFMWIEQGMREMFNTVLEIDTAMTGLYRVTDLTASQYDTLFDNMISSAKEYGATLNDVINATSDWVRAGFDADTALGLAEVTTMYQHISDLDYDTAAENLITAYNGFKNELNGLFGGDEVAAVNYIADIFNELDKQNCP